MRSFSLVCFLALLSFWALDAQAQVTSTDSTISGGTQDSSCVSPLRPRWGAYLIQSFPSPAKMGDLITLQFYNHNDEMLSVKIFDLIDREMLTLQEKALTPAGLHTFQLPANRLSTGTYFLRLTSYTESGSQTNVENSRFVIVH